MSFSPSVHRRFWNWVQSGPVCWLWIGSRDKDGYGRISVGGKYLKAHRLSWQMHFGDIPRGAQVCHTCDNPTCVHPGHLFLGTNADNHRDKAEKSRAARMKLSPADVVVVRAMYAEGWTMRQIARAFDVHRVTISRIVRGLRREAIA